MKNVKLSKAEQTEIENLFCGVSFFFRKTQLQGRNLLVDASKSASSHNCTVEIKDKATDEWEIVSMSLSDFVGDAPVIRS